MVYGPLVRRTSSVHSRENFSLKIDTPDQTKAISLYSTEIEIGGSLSLKIDKMASVRDHCSNYWEVCSKNYCYFTLFK